MANLGPFDLTTEEHEIIDAPARFLPSYVNTASPFEQTPSLETITAYPLNNFSNISLPTMPNTLFEETKPDYTASFPQQSTQSLDQDPSQSQINVLMLEMQRLTAAEQRIKDLYTERLTQSDEITTRMAEQLIILTLRIENVKSRINLLEKDRKIDELQSALNTQQLNFGQLQEELGDQLLSQYFENKQHEEENQRNENFIACLKTENDLLRERLLSLLNQNQTATYMPQPAQAYLTPQYTSQLEDSNRAFLNAPQPATENPLNKRNPPFRKRTI